MKFYFYPRSDRLSTLNPKRVGIVMGVLTVSSVMSWQGYQAYQAYEAEQIRLTQEAQRLAHIETEALDLPFILNKVDELGGSTIQLHWKELTAIAAVQVSNHTELITEEQLSLLATQFIDEKTSTVQDFETVVALNLQEVPTDPESIEGLSRKERQTLRQERERIIEENEAFETLATQYLEDLTYIGYTPEKLRPEATEAQFIASIQAGAIENYHRYGILPSITIAQAILESNWGTSELATRGKNLFGVKVGYDWRGETILMDTREYHNTWIQDHFRKYEEVADSILDHGKFLVENPRYEKAGVFNQRTYRQQALALQEAGYSTDQDEEGNYVYADKLGALIRQYNLQLIDHEVLHP